MTPEPFPYSGDPALRERVTAALERVIDPEMALGIVALGLVYGVEATAAAVKVRLTMTSAACPVSELIAGDVTESLREALGEETAVEIEMCWEPPWGPERMSPAARAAMGWE
jgi:metal-sulfur cluster biosynthetic enzyme